MNRPVVLRVFRQATYPSATREHIQVLGSIVSACLSSTGMEHICRVWRVGIQCYLPSLNVKRVVLQSNLASAFTTRQCYTRHSYDDDGFDSLT